MNAQTKIEPPGNRYVRKQHALEDLRREFDAKYQALVAEFAMRRSRIEREYM